MGKDTRRSLKRFLFVCGTLGGAYGGYRVGGGPLAARFALKRPVLAGVLGGAALGGLATVAAARKAEHLWMRATGE